MHNEVLVYHVSNNIVLAEHSVLFSKFNDELCFFVNLVGYST
jgi:hypothetical protein